jgi:hypothetical protein
MKLLATIGLCTAGIINLLPASGVLGRSWLQSLYGFDIGGADLEILLRHRAVLFAIVGVLLMAAAALPWLRPVAIAVGFVSMASFIVVAVTVGGYGLAITRIIIADLIGLAALIPAALQLRSAA